jgi:hypothetical protein
LGHYLNGRNQSPVSGFLPNIFNIGEVKITDTYHKFLGLTRIGDNMALL